MTTPRAIARPAATTSSVPQLIFGDLWEYDPAPETADPKLKPKYDLFIGGKFVAPKSGKYFDSLHPATEEGLAQIVLANQEIIHDEGEVREEEGCLSLNGFRGYVMRHKYMTIKRQN